MKGRVAMPLFDVAARARNMPLRDALALPPQRGTVNAFWLGQAGFALRAADALVLIDPYLSDSLAIKYRDAEFKHTRMMPPPLEPGDARGVTLLLATHAHSDHLDPGSVGAIMANNPDCLLVCPASVVPAALERGADAGRVVGMHSMETKRFGSVALELLPSAHEELATDENGDTLYGGFVIRMDGFAIYHSGDCAPFDRQADMLRERHADIALLPVNGRDANRRSEGILGNFTVDEAASLCLDAGIPFLVPHHFGMFDFNTVAPETIQAALERYAPRGLRWIIPESGQCLSITPLRQDR
jgi:L-ascorbate metabolism protein UlaG (beta-lactamase superfamily)